MTVGKVEIIGRRVYIVVNQQGTLEKLNKITILGQFILEIMQGLGINQDLSYIRKFVYKHKKRGK